MIGKEPVLDVRQLSIAFTQYEKKLKRIELQVIKDLNVKICAGEIVAVIGSSGSGKSLLAHGILGILPYNATLGGSMYYKGKPLTQSRKEKLRGHEIALVPQSVSYLDPLMKMEQQLQKSRKEKAVRQRSSDILAHFGLADKTKQMYPFELSGGMARRILISTAVMENPSLVIADEPTPGLHAGVARRVMGHFREMADNGAGVLLITHDLELALAAADRVVVFYAGTTIEEALVTDFAQEETLRHPYTRALWRALPQNGFHAIWGAQPYAGELPQGCAFAPRCDMADEGCVQEVPYRECSGGYVRCRKAGMGI